MDLGGCTWEWIGDQWTKLSGQCPTGQSCAAPQGNGNYVGEQRGTLCTTP